MPSGGRPPCRCRLAAHVAKELPNGSLELAACDYGIDDAVLEEKLRRLESFGELLPDRLLDHARAGESNDRARLREDCVTEHREAGADAARRWIGENRYVRNPPLGKLG